MRATVRVWFELSVTDKVALKLTESGGVKTTCTVQLWCTPSEAGQLLVWVKVPSAGEMVIDAIVTGPAPSFVTVMSMGAVLVPGNTLGKVRLLGETAKA